MKFLGDSDGTRLDQALSWLNEPSSWGVEGELLTIEADPKTDFFQGLEGFDNDSACLLYRQVSGDFTLSALVQVDHRAFADAGCLTIRHDPRTWAKVCLERSPIGDLNVVSVVTKTTSDDCTSELLTEGRRYMRISRRGQEFAIHHSAEGKEWRFVRFFLLDVPESLLVGVHAQSPFGEGVTASFSDVELVDAPVADYRSGE